MSKVSVITVCYNAVNCLEKTILSVIGQAQVMTEFIIVDGASQDGTIDVIKKYEDKISKWTSEPDRGIYDAMNKGIKKATGDWLIFMNAGDCFHNDHVIEDFLKIADMKYDVIYGSINKVLSDIHYRYDPYPIEMMNKCMILPHQGTFIKTRFHKQHLFDISFRSSGDYHFFFNAYFKFGAQFQQIDLIVADFDESGGMSKTNIKTARMEDLRIWGKEHCVYPAMRMRLRILYWYLLKILSNMLPYKYKIKWRNYRLLKRGYVLIANK